jgi:hypothetical protein
LVLADKLEHVVHDIKGDLGGEKSLVSVEDQCLGLFAPSARTVDCRRLCRRECKRLGDFGGPSGLGGLSDGLCLDGCGFGGSKG